MSKHSQATLQKDEKKTSLTLQNQEVYTPVLPVEQMERLHSFCPEGVKWILEQTQIEAEHRRKETSRVNIFIFIEHLLGQIFGFLIGIAGVIGGVFAAVNDYPKAGATIAVVAIGTLAVAFIGKLTKNK